MSDLLEVARSLSTDDVSGLLNPLLRGLEAGVDLAHDEAIMRAATVLTAAAFPDRLDFDRRLAETTAAPPAAALLVRAELLGLARELRLIGSAHCAEALIGLVLSLDGARLAAQV